MKLVAVLVALALCGGCDNAETEAKKRLGEVGDKAESEAKRRLDQMGDKAGAYVDGQLKALITSAEDGTLEARVLKGASSAKEVAGVAASLSDAVESDTTILPIYRPIDSDHKDVDKAIGDMPRTEVVDGVTIGFKRLAQIDTKQKVDEDAYLVLWRKDDRLMGFVYKRKRRIDIDALVKEAPKLVAIVTKAG